MTMENFYCLNSLSLMPSEVLLKIYSYLSHKDLNNVSRVSKRMHQLGTDPFLWANFNMKVKFKKIESHRTLFIAQTLSKVTKIDRLRYLKHIDLCDNDLSSVNCKVLGIIVNIVEDCDISYTDLTSEQVEHIFEVMMSNTRLKKLNIRGNCLRTVPPSTLSKTINKMEDINIWNTRLTKSQVMQLFDDMSEQSNLKVINIGENILISVEALKFAKALGKVTTVKLENAYLRKLQVATFFKSLPKNNPIKCLEICCNNLSEVEEEILSVIVNQLSEVNLSQTKLSGGQCKELFRKMIEGTNLKVFKINEVDLSAVPANTLAEAIIQVEDIEMSKTKLSIYQGIYIFSKLSEKPKTKKLKIDNNDFSLVPVDYISKGVNKLKEVDLVGSKLTDIQMTAIFIEMLDNSTIEKIALDGDVESRYNEFVKSLKDRVNVIVTFDRSHEITTIHLFKKF